MAGDPYRLLEIEPTATDAEIRRAYELRLSRLSKSGALRVAQDVDAAYELLSNPHRRSLYDRHGITDPLTRVHPLQRWAPPRPVPFRQWSPPPPPTNIPTRTRPATAMSCAARRARGLAVGLGLSLAASLAWHLATSPRGTTTSTFVVPHQVEVVCQPYDGAAGYSFSASSGSPVTCSNGATPEVVDQ